jgi:hypothetical protein
MDWRVQVSLWRKAYELVAKYFVNLSEKDVAIHGQLVVLFVLSQERSFEKLCDALHEKPWARLLWRLDDKMWHPCEQTSLLEQLMATMQSLPFEKIPVNWTTVGKGVARRAIPAAPRPPVAIAPPAQPVVAISRPRQLLLDKTNAILADLDTSLKNSEAYKQEAETIFQNVDPTNPDIPTIKKEVDEIETIYLKIEATAKNAEKLLTGITTNMSNSAIRTRVNDLQTYTNEIKVFEADIFVSLKKIRSSASPPTATAAKTANPVVIQDAKFNLDLIQEQITKAKDLSDQIDENLKAARVIDVSDPLTEEISRAVTKAADEYLAAFERQTEAKKIYDDDITNFKDDTLANLAVTGIGTKYRETSRIVINLGNILTDTDTALTTLKKKNNISTTATPPASGLAAVLSGLITNPAGVASFASRPVKPAGLAISTGGPSVSTGVVHASLGGTPAPNNPSGSSSSSGSGASTPTPSGTLTASKAARDPAIQDSFKRVGDTTEAVLWWHLAYLFSGGITAEEAVKIIFSKTGVEYDRDFMKSCLDNRKQIGKRSLDDVLVFMKSLYALVS